MGSYFTVSREKASPPVFRCRVQCIRYGCVGLGGRSRWLMAINRRRLWKKWKRERERRGYARVRVRRARENGSRSDNSVRRTLAWPAKRLYAVCALYGNTARVPTPIFIYCRYNALLLPPGTIHLSGSPSRDRESSSPADGTTRLAASSCHPIQIYNMKKAVTWRLNLTSWTY